MGRGIFQVMESAAEAKFDAAIEASRNEDSAASLALSEAADCADQGELDGEQWYVFAVGVAAHDSRCAHLFT